MFRLVPFVILVAAVAVGSDPQLCRMFECYHSLIHRFMDCLYVCPPDPPQHIQGWIGL